MVSFTLSFSTTYYVMVYLRGDMFRTAFAEIGELRSIIPNEVPVMALTATCTQSVFEAVTNCLLLKEPVVIALSPQRKNITYYVKPN